MKNISIRSATAAALVTTLMAAGPAAQADAVADYFEGKNLRILIGFGAGGGYDTTTRIFARHFSKHMPGHPTIVPQNMPGAGSMKVANFIYNAAPKDGLTIGVFASSTALEPLFGNKKAKFQTSKFNWLGSMHQDTASCTVWKGAGQNIRTLDDLVKAKKPVLFGSTSPAAITSQHALVLKNYLGAPVKIIYGYKGSKAVSLAVQNGEVQGLCGMFESSARGAFSQLIASGDLKVFVQFGPDRAVPFFGDATRLYSKLKSEADRPVLDLIYRQTQLARPMAAPPGVPSDRVAALRKAFMATLRDPALVADAAKRKIEFNPLSATEAMALFAKFEATPKPLIRKAAALIGKKVK
ncbi:MAG: tripartite tricarboxylate transporter substrate-binding protein [Proteobacteria bacterium]|nr:tripartite tricarboxylate transporter substrate-binding protein [Pseudomonadota bacterium]MDA1323207.1 tripartite tricarboxylate transporter substrate-binding protein [Pseudomonadota bacterium]